MQEVREQNIALVTQTALACFVENGIEKTTIRDIAQTGICAIIVTHNMEQATRVSDRTAFFYVGDMVETGPTKQIFSAPKDQRLQDYLTGRFG